MQYIEGEKEGSDDEYDEDEDEDDDDDDDNEASDSEPVGVQISSLKMADEVCLYYLCIIIKYQMSDFCFIMIFFSL